MKFETQGVYEEPDFSGSGDVVGAIHLSSTFARQKVGVPTKGYEYSRSGNPTRHVLEKKIALLEGGKHGFVFSSGLAAQTMLLLALLESGDHIIAGDDLYGGSKRLFNSVFSEKMDIDVTYVDTTDALNVSAAIKKDTALIWIETPTNPLLKLSDIRALSNIASERGVLLVVDNTFMSPFFQRPLDLGADIVVHSTTKYVNGHCDSVGGALVVDTDGLAEQIRYHQNAAGAILSPFDSFLVNRGLKTLALRMKRHEENAQAIAAFLESHEKVSSVIYPGLRSHPQHDLAARQMSGFGGMLSFVVKGGGEGAIRFMEALRLLSIAESLGGVESLINHPASMTHASIGREERETLGISDSLVRLSVGIENVEDIIADLRQALEKI